MGKCEALGHDGPECGKHQGAAQKGPSGDIAHIPARGNLQTLNIIKGVVKPVKDIGKASLSK